MVPGNSGQPQFQRVALPNAEFLEEEPLYVNAKQYRRILKRRQARAKLEAEGKIPKERPVSASLFFFCQKRNFLILHLQCIIIYRNICMNRDTDMQ